MARSVEAALRGRAVADAVVEPVMRALALAMEPRLAALDDDHHPAYLHPGRSLLVLLHDVEQLDPEALPLAALHESGEAALRAPVDRVRAELGPGVADALDELPLPGAEDLAEALVLLDRGAALAVLAERLDHLRHLHLAPERAASWPAVHEEVERVWRPFAARIDERLTVRYAHWSRTFARRIRRQLPRV
jgi:hypothetical protein